MRSDLVGLVERMARREADAARWPAPFEEAGDHRPRIRVRRLPCPTCGARDDGRAPDLPFGGEDADGPVLMLLACESLTARAAVPVALAAGAGTGPAAGFRSRGLSWLALAGPDPAPDATVLAAVDAAEAWADGPAAPALAGTGPYTVPASTRPYRPDAGWDEHRRALRPRFLSPHPIVSAVLDGLYLDTYTAEIAGPTRP